ncbi:hypothetical protein AALA00_12855 [Lachnospiraceae bacterium 46-15]
MSNKKKVRILVADEYYALEVGPETIPISGYKVQSFIGGATELCVTLIGTANDLELENCLGCKEGRKSYKAADLDTFWRGQKNIVLLDPNITACKDWKELFQQLIDSGAWVDFSQGVDIRLMTEEKAEMIKRIRTKNIHFAWDRYGDREEVIAKFRMFQELTGWGHRKMTVYVLTNFDTTHEQDLERVYTLRDLGFTPYVMVYNKGDFVLHDKKGKPMKRKPMGELLEKYTEGQIRHFAKCWDLQRWVNNRVIFRSCDRFGDYKGRVKGCS